MSTEQNNKAFAETDDVEAALRGMKRVEAPSDFDMRLKARIANRRTARQRPGFGFLKVAAPAALTVAVAVSGYVMWQQPSEILIPNSLQAAAEPSPAAAASPETPETSSSPEIASGGERVNNGAQPEQPSRPAANQSQRRPAPELDSRGSSVDRAVGEPEETIFPRGIQPQAPVDAVPVMPENDAELAVEEVLSLLGIRAAFSEGEWRVLGTDPNGAAARSGVRAGDVILSMGPTELGSRKTLRARGSIPNIRVRRGGAVIDLKIGR